MLKQEQRNNNKSAGPVIQTKLQIGQPGDKYEREADAVADRVMSMPDRNHMQLQPIEEEEEMMQPKLRMQPIEEEEAIQMKCTNCEREEMMQPKIQMQTVGKMVATSVEKISISEEEKNNQQGQATENGGQNPSSTSDVDQKEIIQTKSNSGNYEISPKFQNELNSSKGAGVGLSPETKNFMGSAMGANFVDVRIHNDQKSNDLNESIQSRAFTYGSDIYFKQGEYNPNSYEGEKLLAHELTHSIQQGASPQSSNNENKSNSKTAPESVQRAIDTSILLHTYSLSGLTDAMGDSGNSTVNANLRRIESSAISSFGSRNPVLNMNVEDRWYYYASSFAIGCPTSSTTSRAAAILQNCAWEYYSVDDEYSVTFTFRHTGSRPRTGQFATSSGRTRSQTTTLTGGAKLTYSIIELSASASQATTSGSSASTTVTATNFFEHDYDVSIDYDVNYYVAGDFRMNSDFFPGMDQVGGPHVHSGTANIGSITVYDDDNNPDNLTP